MPICNRREFLQGSALGLSLTLAGCSKPPQARARAEARISVLRAGDYGQELYGEIRRVLAEQRLQVRGKRVLLKPNLIEFEPDSPIHTHPLLVHAAFEAFRALGAEVFIAEGPGHRRNTLDLADAAGYFQTIPRFEDFFIDLNLDRVAQVRFAHPRSRLQSIYLAQAALSCDLLVSMPKMKTHHWAGATLSMKNLFGVVPGGVYGWPKNVLHWAGINECIVDLYHALAKTFRHSRRYRGDGRERAHTRQSQAGGRGGGGPRPGGRGRYLLSNHVHRSAAHRVSQAGGGRGRDPQVSPADRRTHPKCQDPLRTASSLAGHPAR